VRPASAGGEQLVVLARFDDASGVREQDPLGGADGLQLVGDDQPGAAAAEGGGGVRDRGCAAAVQGGGLVEDDDPVC
jgi:hypothetical protein